MTEIKFKIDGKACTGKPGQTIVEAAKANGVYIPVLCNSESLKPAGCCRLCTVRINNRPVAACTQPITQDMVIENMVPDLEDMRKELIEMLFVEGNHFCPACEKSGNCELQALGYRYQMMVPRFPYLWHHRQIDASYPKLILEPNRCVHCRRCVRAIKTKDGKNIFGSVLRSKKTETRVDRTLASELTDEMAKKAMDVCPVGAIIKKEIGFVVPIGKRKFDKKPIGSDLQG